MFFEKKKDALLQAKIETIRTGVKHNVLPDSVLRMKTGLYETGYVLQLDVGKKKQKFITKSKKMKAGQVIYRDKGA